MCETNFQILVGISAIIKLCKFLECCLGAALNKVNNIDSNNSKKFLCEIDDFHYIYWVFYSL